MATDVRTAVEPERTARNRLHAYGSLYGPLAVIALTLSFTPLLRLGPSSPTYSLWREAVEPAGGIAMAGIVVMLVLIALLVVAVFRPDVPGLGFAIAVSAALIAVMLATHPGFGADVRLSYFGVACVVVACCCVALGIAHGIHTIVVRTRHQPAPGQYGA